MEEFERQAQEVLKAAIAGDQATELMNTLMSGGTYIFDHHNRTLRCYPRTYLQDLPRDGVTLVMRQLAAMTLLRDEQFRAELMTIMDGVVNGGQVSAMITGVEWDQPNDMMSHGPIALIMRSHWNDALREYKVVGLLYGADGNQP